MTGGGGVSHDTDQTSTSLQMNRPVITHMEQVDDSVMQISETGHWFLEGWIGDHLVEFLVDSGSSVTAMSNSFYQTLVRAGAPLGVLGSTARTLRSANGIGIVVSGALTAWCRSWDCRQSFPYSFATLRPGLMPSLVLMFWAPCCHIPWTLRMASCSHKGVLHQRPR